jgi:hypothetical protein
MVFAKVEKLWIRSDRKRVGRKTIKFFVHTGPLGQTKMVNAAPASRMLSTDAPAVIWPPISPGWQLLAPAQFAILQKRLTGMCRIVYQVKYSHKPSIFMGLQN